MTKRLWCWKCREEVPMLEEHEYLELMRIKKEYCPQWDEVARQGIPVDDWARRCEVAYAPMLEKYEEITGIKVQFPSWIYHHRASIYGPPCHSCGKPYRTPQAKLCAACGAYRDNRAVPWEQRIVASLRREKRPDWPREKRAGASSLRLPTRPKPRPRGRPRENGAGATPKPRRDRHESSVETTSGARGTLRTVFDWTLAAAYLAGMLFFMYVQMGQG